MALLLLLQKLTICPEYPVHSYTLVVEDSEGNMTTHTSQATDHMDTVTITVSGLRKNSRYSYYVLATNQFGDSNPSTPVSVGKMLATHAEALSPLPL